MVLLSLEASSICGIHITILLQFSLSLSLTPSSFPHDIILYRSVKFPSVLIALPSQFLETFGIPITSSLS